MQLTGGQMVCESLIREGVEVIFGIPGGAILPLYQTLPEYPKLRHILTRHEQGASHAAAGCSVCHFRARSHESCDRYRHGVHGLGADGDRDRAGRA